MSVGPAPGSTGGGRRPKIHRDEFRTQGLDRLELNRFLQVAQTLSVHHGALAYLLGINALRACEAAVGALPRGVGTSLHRLSRATQGRVADQAVAEVRVFIVT